MREEGGLGETKYTLDISQQSLHDFKECVSILLLYGQFKTRREFVVFSHLKELRQKPQLLDYLMRFLKIPICQRGIIDVMEGRLNTHVA